MFTNLYERSPLIVAEIGNNHEGSFETAVKLVQAAAECGVDAVKFQVFRTELYVSHADPARFQRLKSFELSFTQFEQLFSLARSLNLKCIATPLDLESAAFLEPLIDSFKIASGDNDFYPLIRFVAGTGKPMIISTGVADFEHLDHLVDYVHDIWLKKGIDGAGLLAFLHCVTSYPVPPEQVNLRAIPFLAAQYHLPVGYSDHTLGIEACLAAAALGAQIIEKHFTLDKHTSDFRDHQLSADPSEMKILVTQAGLIAQMLGQPQKTIQPCEEPLIPVVRRSAIARHTLETGRILGADDIVWVRPAGGIPSSDEDKLLGRKLKKKMAQGEQIAFGDLE